MDASQLWYPRNSAFRPKPQVLQVFTWRRLAKCSETLPNIIWGPMDYNGCFTTWYPEIVHSGSNTSFASFTYRRLEKCSETLPKIILNGCFATLVPRNSAFTLEHKFCIIYVSEVSEMFWNTPKHHCGSNGLEWMLHNFGTPEIVHFGPKHKFCKSLHAEG
jgi:hypothetical protein